VAERKTRVIVKRCNKCDKPLSALIDEDDQPIIKCSDAIAVCTNPACNYEGDEVPVDRSDVKTRWQVEP